MFNESGYESKKLIAGWPGWIGKSGWSTMLFCPHCGNNTGDVDKFMGEYICGECKKTIKWYQLFKSKEEYKNYNRTKLIDEMLCQEKKKKN